jgi:hypothetical protein
LASRNSSSAEVFSSPPRNPSSCPSRSAGTIPSALRAGIHSKTVANRFFWRPSKRTPPGLLFSNQYHQVASCCAPTAICAIGRRPPLPLAVPCPCHLSRHQSLSVSCRRVYGGREADGVHRFSPAVFRFARTKGGGE